MEDMNDILNPPEEAKEITPVEEATGSVETPVEDEADTATGETSQVAAENDADSASAQVKAELAALAKERERIRQKEALLDEERSRLSGTEVRTSTQETATETKDPRSEMKEIRKQYREALKNSILDPEDEEAAQLVEDLEDKMEELRHQTQRAMTDKEKAENEYHSVYTEIHDKFPFLAPDHPQANAELNENINAYYHGRIRMGDSKTDALRKAVNLFAPTHAESLGIETAAIEETSASGATKKAEAEKLIAAKLSKGGFSEVRSAGKTQRERFAGPTPMASILGKT